MNQPTDDPKAKRKLSELLVQSKLGIPASHPEQAKPHSAGPAKSPGFPSPRPEAGKLFPGSVKPTVLSSVRPEQPMNPMNQTKQPIPKPVSAVPTSPAPLPGNANLRQPGPSVAAPIDSPASSRPEQEPKPPAAGKVSMNLSHLRVRTPGQAPGQPSGQAPGQPSGQAPGTIRPPSPQPNQSIGGSGSADISKIRFRRAGEAQVSEQSPRKKDSPQPQPPASRIDRGRYSLQKGLDGGGEKYRLDRLGDGPAAVEEHIPSVRMESDRVGSGVSQGFAHASSSEAKAYHDHRLGPGLGEGLLDDSAGQGAKYHDHRLGQGVGKQTEDAEDFEAEK